MIESASVRSDTTAEFDLGPLTWVQGEIDEALTRATDALAVFRGNPADAPSLRHARAHVHQAAGAIQMVGLDGVVAFTDEIERQLARMEELAADAVPKAVDVVDRACKRLRVFLDDVANGAAPIPLALAPEYDAMRKARGEEAPAPADLFYPDLNVRPPRGAPAEIMPAARLASHLLKERRQYQRGLLEWLRGNGSGAATMREAVAAIEDVTAQPALRVFWWTAGALLEALEKKALDASFGVKQLVARIDMQIRRVTEGSAKVADRLRREVLYHIATAKPAAPQIDAVQRAYQLAALIPPPEALDADVVRIKPLLREAREQLASAKDAWLKAASGRGDSLPKLTQLLASAHAKAQEIGRPALTKLTAALAEHLAAMPAQGASEPIAMEFATALLLAESAFENFGNLSPDFAGQVDAMLARLAAAQSGQPTAEAAPALDEMSRRAQERVLLGQVMREVQVNLRHMEQVLDAFFRDHTRRRELAGLAKDGQQIRGALRMLEFDDADRLLALCQTQIESYADPDTPVDEEGLELLAESLSGLGFYIEAVLHQRPDRDRIIAPLIAKREGVAQKPAIVEPQSVEDSVAELRAALPRLLADVRNAPADASVLRELRGKLVSLRDDADLIGDAELSQQVKAAIGEIDGGGENAALAASVDRIVESGATPAPALSEETQRLLATDASALDAELLDIYLTEADEVLDTVDSHLTTLQHSPADRDALVTVRRQFHTLKGSGRMVGLTELGELAWGVERIHNRLLEDDRRVTPAVLALIVVAASSFRHWVRELRDTGRFATDASPLLSAMHAVEAEWPGGAPGALPLPPIASSPKPAPVAPAPVKAEHPIGPVSPPSIASPAVDTEDVAPLAGEAGEGIEFRAPLGEAEAPATHEPPRLPDLELVTFPELGAPIEGGAAPTVTVLEESLDETIDVGLPFDLRDGGKPLLRVVANNTAGLASDARARASTAHAPDLTLLTDAPRTHASAAAGEADEVSVGDVRLASSLWRILCDEADQHVALLQHEVSVLQFDPDHRPIATMVRASHTLCGIHRTGGIALIATTAQALEQTLLALEEHGAPFPGIAQPVLARATAGLAHFVSRVKAREGFTPSDERESADIVGELDELRQEALANLPPAEPLIPAEEGSDRLELVADAEDHAADVATPEAVVETATETSSDVLSDTAVVPAESPLPAAAVDAASSSRNDAPLAPAIDEAPMAPTIDEAAPPIDEAPLASPVEAAPAAHAIDEASLAPAIAEAPLAPTLDEAPLPPTLDEAPLASTLDEAPAVSEAEPTSTHAEREADDESAPPEVAWQAPASPAPVREASPPSDESLLEVVDDVDETILPIFLEEAAELFPRAGEILRGWRRAPDDASGPAHLRRTLHTLKGSARMAGAMRLGELAHRMESRLVSGESDVAPSAELFETLDTDLDRVSFVLDALRDGKANVPLPWLAPLPPSSEAAPATPEATAPIEPSTPTPAPATSQFTAFSHPRRRASDRMEGEGGRAMLRVRADIVDQLVNEAGEVAIARARVEGELRALKANLLELTSSVIRLRSQVREIELQAETQIQSRMSTATTTHEEFDPLELDRFTRFQELTRSLAEGVNDVSTVQQSLLKNLDDADAALLAQARLSRDVQQRLFAIRTVPFASLSERLYRILRKTARELDKRANLEIHGGQTELDRSVLEKLVGPLEHLLRNALDHGLEPRATRLAAGKSETGEIALTVRQVGNEIAIELADDGAGIDFERVRERAVSLGILAAESEPTIHQLVECLFHPGFSTAAQVTQISGRGIGMDVVRSEIAALGGRVDVHTAPGKGTRFNLFLPLTLAVAQAVLVRAGGRQWAIPATMVEQVQQVKADVLRSIYGDARVQWHGRAWAFHYLPRLLGDAASMPEIARYNPVLLVKSGQGIAAIHVDEMLGNQEIVVKNIGTQLARVQGISGATVLGTGEIVLIINPVQLAQRGDVLRDESPDAARLPATQEAPARKLVMVVDDSLTVRKFSMRLLTREGYDVVTARDGVDALKLLSDHAPDAILLDIEMPRMDGFEFAKTIKGDAKTASIPIVMITSRTADKHRNRAAQLGVDRFLGKPYQEDELLGEIRELLGVVPS
ncbi:MAG TPA: Hpt domain-containing protein [Casimicrobiaceae bacterium]|nr:Hpt domain-containing protein [Casimicrobiaceae bacterium]